MTVIKHVRWIPVTAAILATAASGCKSGSAPELADVGDQVAAVGEALTLQLFASDADGDDISFSFSAAGLPDVASTTSLTIAPDGRGVFTLIPIASQVGVQFFDFVASDGRYDTRLTISIEIRGAVGSDSAPIFRQPLGPGTTLVLGDTECTSFNIEIEDADSTTIALSALPPLVDNSTLEIDTSGLTGTWSWCPTRDQIATSDRWDITLSADDGENPATLKDYLIYLRNGSDNSCPGAAPNIAHAPANANTRLDVPVRANISDDLGLKSAPVVLYATEDPGNPVDFSRLSLLEMTLERGDMTNGEWAAFLPNPVATGDEGDTAQLYYVITANDDDDADGDCDHQVDSPESGVHKISVTYASDEGAGLCAPCSSNAQCGSDRALCLTGPDGSFCGRGCSDTEPCPSDYACSAQEVTSVDGVAARQCVPNSGSCTADSDCEDDFFEDDDNPQQAAALGPVGIGGNLGTLCPNDEDWFLIELTSDASIELELVGANPPNMNLALTDRDGVLIDDSRGLTSIEAFETGCLSAGQYYARVDSDVDDGSFGDYTLTVGTRASACQTPPPPPTDCCSEQNTPGCSDPAVQACVCADDSSCCTDSWDLFCVDSVGALLCARPCEPDDFDGSCCESNFTPGCEVNSIEECVCAADSFCCESGWDSTCVDVVETAGCGVCPS